MNRPDEKTLNKWLEGELRGEELLEVDAWAEIHAGDLDNEFKCKIGWDALNDAIFSEMLDTVDPPYPEFFNNKVQQAITDQESAPTRVASDSSFWQKLRLIIAPAAIAALVAFYAGTQMQSSQSTEANNLATNGSSVYIPHTGIVAAVSESNAATEIILNGLAPISDELDIAAGDTSPGISPMMAGTHDEENLHDIFY